MRDDLALSDEQRAQVTQLFERLDQNRQDSFEKFHQLAPDQRQKRFLEEVRSNEEAIVAILQPAQLDRLRQIAWQCHGPMAFHDPNVVSELKLTIEQKQQIRTIEASMFFDRPPPPPGDSPTKASRKGFDERRRSVMKQMLAVLTEAQMKRWNELIGRPFLGADRVFLPPGPPPGGFMPPPKGKF